MSPPPLASSPAPLRPRRRRQRRRRRPLWRIITSILYHTSFSFFILVLAVLFVSSAWALSEQALRSGEVEVGQRNVNVFIIAGAYAVLSLISLAHVWSRLLSIKKILRTMPKPYIPIKQMDVPKEVADHIMVEYSRTAVIAHISQATKGSQEGWGRPGTKWDNQHFRTYILSTIPTMRNALASTSTAPPHALDPLLAAADCHSHSSESVSASGADDQGALLLFVNSYVKLVDQARYSKREPTELDAAACEKVVEFVQLTMRLKRLRERESALNDD